MRFKGIIFDIDGVLYKGHTPIEGAPRALSALRNMGLKLFFLTNNSTKTREENVKKFEGMGIRAEKEEIYCSAHETALYLKEKYKKGSALVIGGDGLSEELRRAGIKVSNKTNADFVVVGLDRNFNYNKLSDAMEAIKNGALFIATNADPTFPVEDRLLPGCGVMVAALSECTGKQPDVVIGKPNPYMLARIINESRLKRSELALVGDRLDIDIAAANKAGVYSVCVLTGITSRKDALSAKGEKKPKLILKSVKELGDFLNASNSVSHAL